MGIGNRAKMPRRPAGTVTKDRVEVSQAHKTTVERLQEDLAKAKALTIEAGKA